MDKWVSSESVWQMSYAVMSLIRHSHITMKVVFQDGSHYKMFVNNVNKLIIDTRTKFEQSLNCCGTLDNLNDLENVFPYHNFKS